MSDPNVQDEFIIDEIMPANTIHLIGGPSGAGKTTFTLQIITEWSAGRSVFGYESHPKPYLYISVDRSGKAFRRILKRMNSKLDVPFYSLVDNNVPRDIGSILKQARKINPQVKVVFIDGIHSLIPGGKISDYAAVSEWLCEINRRCEQMGITVVGIGHSAKVKEGENYQNPRQRLLGSVAWAGFSDCIILVEPAVANDPTITTRVVSILPRNSPEQVIHYHFDSMGRLVDGDMEDATLLLEQQVRKLKPGDVRPTAFFLDLGDKLGLAKRTAERWLPLAVEAGLLEKVRKGMYKVPWKS